MKRTVYLCLVVTLYTGCGLATERYNEDKSIATEFALRVQAAVAAQDREALSEFPCLPTPCMNESKITLLLGTENETTPQERILGDTSTMVKVIGPFESMRKSGRIFAVLFILTSSPTAKYQQLPPKSMGIKEFNKSFTQTSVFVSEGKAYFWYDPFHLESHHPYVDDYG